jgi:DNA-directed RNA polymerase subunit RPC12/RpoP
MFAHCLIPVFLFLGIVWSHPRLAVTNVACPYCIRIFVNKSNLRVHIRDVHSADKGPFSCVRCGKQVKNRNCLRVHMYRRHTP